MAQKARQHFFANQYQFALMRDKNERELTDGMRVRLRVKKLRLTVIGTISLGFDNFSVTVTESISQPKNEAEQYPVGSIYTDHHRFSQMLEILDD